MLKRQSQVRQWFLNGLLMVVSLAVGYFLVEASYRIYLYYTLAIETKFGIATFDVRQPPVNLAAPGNIF